MVINLQPFFGTIHSISIEKPLKHIKNNLLPNSVEMIKIVN